MAKAKAQKSVSFTAHRVVRAMTKTCATQQIKAEGFALVALIAHQWDSLRYARPVGYHIASLMNLLSITSKQTFYRVEERCLIAGWLVKVNQGTRLPVLYHVSIPEHAREMGDGPTEDGIGLLIGAGGNTNRGTNPEPIRDANGTQTVLKPAPFLPSPSSLALNPIPGGEPDPASVFEVTAPPPTASTAQRWLYERLQPWAEALIAIVDSKIHKGNWPTWKRLVDAERYGLKRVLSAAESLPSIQRWPANVEEILESAPRPSPPATPTNAITPERQIAVILKHGGGWKNVCKLAALDFEVTGEEMLRDILGEDYRTRNELYAKAIA